MASRGSQRAPAPGQTVTYEAQSISQDGSSQRVLRLRAEDSVTPNVEEGETSRHIRWSEDVVDNERKGKKSSKGEPSSVFSRDK